MSVLLPLMVAVPLGAGFLLALMPETLAKAADALAVATCAAMLAGALALFNFEGGYAIGGWSPPVGVNMTLDGFSAFLLLTVAAVTFCAVVFSVRYMKLYTAGPRFMALLLLMVAGINGVLLSGDIFNRFVYVEIAAIASYVLVGFGCGVGELKAALKYAVLGALASVLTLMAIALLYALYGTVNIAHLAEKIDEPVVAGTSVVFMAATLFFAGFGFKAALVPLHIWQPDAMQTAPAPVSAMISGALIEVIGIYAMIRTVYSVFGVTEQLGWMMLSLGVISMTAGAACALRQEDHRRFLAYNSISQIGYVLCGFAVGGILVAGGGRAGPAALAVAGALFHMATHAVSKSLLFLNAGAAQYGSGAGREGSTDGVGYSTRLTTISWLAGALSSAAMPPFAGFFSKAMLIFAFITAGYYWLAAVAIAVAILTFASFVRVHRRMRAQVRVSGRAKAAIKTPIPMAVSLALLSSLCLAMSPLALPRWRDLFLEPAQDTILSTAHPVNLTLWREYVEEQD